MKMWKTIFRSHHATRCLCVWVHVCGYPVTQLRLRQMPRVCNTYIIYIVTATYNHCHPLAFGCRCMLPVSGYHTNTCRNNMGECFFNIEIWNIWVYNVRQPAQHDRCARTNIINIKTVLIMPSSQKHCFVHGWDQNTVPAKVCQNVWPWLPPAMKCWIFSNTNICTLARSCTAMRA